MAKRKAEWDAQPASPKRLKNDVEGTAKFCTRDGKRWRICQAPECDKRARDKTNFCIKHGGGRRCHVASCTKSARARSDFCIKHGGGRRCQFRDLFFAAGCDKAARDDTDFCVKHWGGRRCQKPECDKGAVSPSKFCLKHKRIRVRPVKIISISEEKQTKEHFIPGLSQTEQLNEYSSDYQGDEYFGNISYENQYERRLCQSDKCTEWAAPLDIYCVAHSLSTFTLAF